MASGFDWVEEYETFGWLVVTGMSESEVVARLGAGAAVELAAGEAWQWDGPSFGVRAVGDRLLMWDDARLGLDARAPLWLSESGQCVSVAWGMNSSCLTVAEQGRLVRRFDPMMRGPVEDDDELYEDEADAEADRDGDPLEAEAEVDWAASTKTASLHLLELLTGVAVEPDPWDDSQLHWYGVPDLPAEPAPAIPPLFVRLQEASPQERDARLEAGLRMAAEIAGLQEHPSFLRALEDADVVRALADPLGTPPLRDEIGPIEAFLGDNPRRRAADQEAVGRVMRDWEFPLGERVDPARYQGNGPPPSRAALAYVPTESERAELALAAACSSFIVQSGLHECDDRWVGEVVNGIRIAAGDRWAAVEQVMMGESD